MWVCMHVCVWGGVGVGVCVCVHMWGGSDLYVPTTLPSPPLHRVVAVDQLMYIKEDLIIPQVRLCTVVCVQYPQ